MSQYFLVVGTVYDLGEWVMVSFSFLHGAFLVKLPHSPLCQLPQDDHHCLQLMIWLLCRRPFLVLESCEVFKLARYAMPMKEYLIMAAERVLRRAEGSAALV